MGRTTSDGGRSWYRRPNLWIWLAVFYVLSPKMGTIAALAAICQAFQAGPNAPAEQNFELIAMS